MRRTHSLALLLLALGLTASPALALPIDRGVVEDGTDADTADDATNGGITLVKNNGTTRLRPATCSSNVCTRSVPSASTEGLKLEDIMSWRLQVCAPSGNTLAGTGTLELWLLDPVTSLWGPMKAKHLSVTESSARCQTFPVELNGMAGAGVRVIYRANEVGISGATGSLIVSMQACKRGSVPLGSYGSPGCGT